MKIYIGIDPGATGAVAFIFPREMRVFDFEDGDALWWLAESKHEAKAIIEKVSAMPTQGVSSMFNTGENFGIWQGRLQALGISYDLITPQRWKKEMFDFLPAPIPAKKGETAKEKRKRINERSKMLKELSRQRALRLFPQMAEYLKRKKDHNRAEALLLAEYARRMNK